MHTYQKTLIVSSEDIDELQHVNNVVYVQWVQDIAKEHWFDTTPSQLHDETYWVVLKHEINYKSQAFEGDEITVRTHVTSWKGPFSERIVEFHKGETLLVKAVTNWCFIQAATGKPKRVSPEIIALFSQIKPAPFLKTNK